MTDTRRFVAALDPGITTGYARALVEGTTFHWVDTGELSFPDLVTKWHVLFSGVTDVVVEDWRIYPGKQQAFTLQHQPAAEMLGAIRALAYEHDQVDIARQAASQGKRRWTNKRLAQHGYTAKGHARDALRHLLTYCEDKLAMDFIDRSEPI